MECCLVVVTESNFPFEVFLPAPVWVNPWAVLVFTNPDIFTYFAHILINFFYVKPEWENDHIPVLLLSLMCNVCMYFVTLNYPTLGRV